MSSGVSFIVFVGVLVFVREFVGPGTIFAGTLVMGLVSVVVVPSATYLFMVLKELFLTKFSQNLYGEEPITEMEQKTSIGFAHGGEVDCAEKAAHQTKSEKVVAQHAESEASFSNDKRLLWERRRAVANPLTKSADQGA